MAILQRLIPLLSFIILTTIMLIDKDVADENSGHVKGIIGTVIYDNSKIG